MNPSMLARTVAASAVVATGACAQVVEPSPGAAPVSELREASGASKGRVATILRTLRHFGLVESHRQFAAPSIHFIVPDAFKRIHDDVAQCLRTYGQGVTRLDRDLARQAAGNDKRAANKDLSDETRQQAERRAAKARRRRLETYAHLHPDLSKEGIADHIYAPTVILTGQHRGVGPEMPAPGEAAWNRLVELTGQVDRSPREYGELRTLDLLLGAGVKFELGAFDSDAYDQIVEADKAELERRQALALTANLRQPAQGVMEYVS